MSFIEKLDLLLDKKRMNKNMLSRDTGIPYSTIDGFYRKGTDNIKLSTLKKLATYFDVTVDYLVDDENDMNNLEYKVSRDYQNENQLYIDLKEYAPNNPNEIDEYTKSYLEFNKKFAIHDINIRMENDIKLVQLISNLSQLNYDDRILVKNLVHRLSKNTYKDE